MDTGGRTDAHGVAIAAVALVATVATLLLRPGSGSGPAVAAVLAWIALIGVAVSAAITSEGSLARHRLGGAVLASGLIVVFVSTVGSAWSLAIPVMASVGALIRRRSWPRVVATWAAAIALVVVVAGS